jgi:hypothetical protein
MTARLLGQNTLAGGLRTILNDVIALHGAEFGNIQLAIDDDTLALIEHRGFDEPSLRSLRRVARDGGAASARAFAARKPVVIPDLFKDRALAPYHQLANTMGIRAMQSTPFIAAGGKCVGVVSTHFANVHTPTEIEMETLQQYGFVAADFIISKTQGASCCRRRRVFPAADGGRRGAGAAATRVNEARTGLRPAADARASARFRRLRTDRRAQR